MQLGEDVLTTFGTLKRDGHIPHAWTFKWVMRREIPAALVAAALGGIRSVDDSGAWFECTYMGTEVFLNPADHIQGDILYAIHRRCDRVTPHGSLGEGKTCATVNRDVSSLRAIPANT